MAIVVLTFIGSEDEISSGIPRTVTIESNIPATIYFTLDGSTPDRNSPIYVDTFTMPDNMTSVILSAFGVGADDIDGPILVQTFAPDMSHVTISKNIGPEGVTVDMADDDTNITNGFGPSGEAVRFLDIDPIYLDIIKF
jgi:hypothetical protein